MAPDKTLITPNNITETTLGIKTCNDLTIETTFNTMVRTKSGNEYVLEWWEDEVITDKKGNIKDGSTVTVEQTNPNRITVKVTENV